MNEHFHSTMNELSWCGAFTVPWSTSPFPSSLRAVLHSDGGAEKGSRPAAALTLMHRDALHILR